MTLVDLNVVLYAINTAAAHHAETRTWWESALNGDEPATLVSFDNDFARFRNLRWINPGRPRS